MTDIYSDIAARTGGDIYIGVVGPVRTGKSTFIKQFMEQLVIPNIDSDYRRERASDELPQSAAGRTIMTTEPKFIPEEAVTVNVGTASFRLRMIDCVGYVIPSAQGYIEDSAPRMVMTPWFDAEVPFNMAAEVGTRKVITEHSTVGLVITTDGSISDLPREEYAECEERVISELRETGKPFAVLLNCLEPHSPSSKALAKRLSSQYGVNVLPISCADLSGEDIERILTELLYAFPVTEIAVNAPSWINSLDRGHWLRSAFYESIRAAAEKVTTLRDLPEFVRVLSECEHITSASVTSAELSSGKAEVAAVLESSLFIRIIGEAAGIPLENESELIPKITELVKIREKYSRLAGALEEAERTGYGIVMPSAGELTLEEPEIIKQGGKYGIRLRATAPSIHLMKTQIQTEVAPIVGSEKQSEELVMSLMSDFDDAPERIWESNIFGKSLHELVTEGLNAKLGKLPPEARRRLCETLARMINEGCSGLICLIL
ncbi:stage IV sporulation protein A [Ruminococcus sp. YE71]|uniref:stage IV sporulation protein A n=1 Tax=unclassified Ruminococcus TaxID=2608920 RepID=UPI00087F383B|nr:MULTISPECIES: stage IV sporulation protein A [unclassified Ruminococcus]SDA17241.1 stage IV sporulation protein A [Ruminococcus sp. YE78]SFW26547.1 stage IV sporulation protein A [Ruminococcus sp. YE71]